MHYLDSLRDHSFLSCFQSLFPKSIQKRLVAEITDRGSRTKSTSGAKNQSPNRNKGTANERLSTKPIADLFPESTVMFADLVGFTAWCSTREPSQVFELLEAIFNKFDALVEQRGVYKVETVGDW